MTIKMSSMTVDKTLLFELQLKIGYKFKSESLLVKALTHKSLGEENYERLEFLGDSVLNTIISVALFDHYKDREGGLTQKRSQLVSNKALAIVAKTKLDLGKYTRVAKDSLVSLADVLEALVGAVYVDGGQEAAQCLVMKYCWDPFIGSLVNSPPKSAPGGRQENVITFNPEKRLFPREPNMDSILSSIPIDGPKEQLLNLVKSFPNLKAPHLDIKACSEFKKNKCLATVTMIPVGQVCASGKIPSEAGRKAFRLMLRKVQLFLLKDKRGNRIKGNAVVTIN